MRTRWLMLIAVSLASYVAGALTPVAFGQASKPPLRASDDGVCGPSTLPMWRPDPTKSMPSWPREGHE